MVVLAEHQYITCQLLKQHTNNYTSYELQESMSLKAAIIQLCTLDYCLHVHSINAIYGSVSQQS